MGDMILYRSTNGFGADLKKYKVMTVVINEADSNPATCCSYADDAVNMQSGSSANAQWQEFFGYKPCLFKNGQVVGYLNPNDYSKFENGSPADITSGDAGDVMIEFPRRGIRSVKDGNTIRISMTDAPNASGFKYYAHQRGLSQKDAFYVGAYLASIPNSGIIRPNMRVPETALLRSISSQTLPRITIDGSVDASEQYHKCFQTTAHQTGNGYEYMPYTIWSYIQILYVLQFKNLDSVNTIGYKKEADYDVYQTGSANTRGLIYINSNTNSTKVFGFEDLMLFAFMCDGIAVENHVTDHVFVYIALGIDSYNMDYDQYTLICDWKDYIGHVVREKFISSVLGTTEAPFIPIAGSGSATTYYCDGFATPVLSGSGIGPSRPSLVSNYLNSTLESYRDRGGIFHLSDTPDANNAAVTRLCFV